MGKSKQRSIRRGKNDQFSNLTREQAIKIVVSLLESGDKEAYGLITLFGLSAEELLEEGASYETVAGMKCILK